MNDQMIPFPLERDIELPTQTLTVFAASAIKVLADAGRTAKVVYQGEHPYLPYEEDMFDLTEVENEYSLPIEVQRRINILRNNHIPMKQILIAHEHPSRSKALLETQKREEREEKVGRAVSGIGKAVAWTGGALAIAVAGIALLPLVAIGLGIVVAAGTAFFMVTSGLDPAVVVILDDEESSWVTMGMWYE